MKPLRNVSIVPVDTHAYLATATAEIIAEGVNDLAGISPAILEALEKDPKIKKALKKRFKSVSALIETALGKDFGKLNEAFREFRLQHNMLGQEMVAAHKQLLKNPKDSAAALVKIWKQFYDEFLPNFPIDTVRDVYGSMVHFLKKFVMWWAVAKPWTSRILSKLRKKEKRSLRRYDVPVYRLSSTVIYKNALYRIVRPEDFEDLIYRRLRTAAEDKSKEEIDKEYAMSIYDFYRVQYERMQDLLNISTSLVPLFKQLDSLRKTYTQILGAAEPEATAYGEEVRTSAFTVKDWLTLYEAVFAFAVEVRKAFFGVDKLEKLPKLLSDLAKFERYNKALAQELGLLL